MAQVTRREAARRATHLDILAAARRLVAESGPTGVSLRAVANEVGMTAPAIYRYFPSHEDLLLALTEQVVGELVDALHEAVADLPADEPALRLVASTRAFRAWCIGHQHEFQLAFGLTPAPAEGMPPHCDTENVRNLCGYFLTLFVELWRTYQFPVEADEAIPEGLAAQLRTFLETRDDDVPIGLVKIYLDAWVRLYGMVAMEIYGHLRFILTDTDVMFDAMLTEYATLLLGPAFDEQAAGATQA